MSSTPAMIGAATALVVVIAARALMMPSAEGPGTAATIDAAFAPCLDVERQIVAHKPAAECTGRVISEDEAAAVLDRRILRLHAKRAEQPPVVPDGTPLGRGSGFFISDVGHILTNHHVVEGCSTVSADPVTQDPRVVEVLAVDPEFDLAVIESDFPRARSVRFRRGRPVATGEPIAIVGYPLHGLATIKPIYRQGSVIEPALPMAGYDRRYQVRIDVRRGNSGGPVLDAAGLVVGVISAKVNTPVAFRNTGRVIRQVGVAIDGEAVMDFLRRNRIPFRIADPGAPRETGEIFSEARGYVARLTCWR